MQAVSSRAWSELLHAQVGALLGRAGIPCLHIKGPTVATWEALYAEGERNWGDVDILLPPSGMDRALEVLLASGFSHRDPGLRWRTSEDHALTLWHDPDGRATHGAAAEVDVHHRFQGMEGDPERAFAELWRRREPAELGGLDVWFPDLPSRQPDPGAQRGARPEGTQGARGPAPSRSPWRRTPTGAHHRPRRRVDALQALRAGIEMEPDGHDLVARTSLADVQVSAAWRLRAQGSTRTAVRIEELREPGHRRQDPHDGGLGRAVPRRDPLPRPDERPTARGCSCGRTPPATARAWSACGSPRASSASSAAASRGRSRWPEPPRHPVEVDCDDLEVERVVRELLADLLASPVTPTRRNGSLSTAACPDVLAELVEHLDDAQSGSAPVP